jgi:hypothetical protein
MPGKPVTSLPGAIDTDQARPSGGAPLRIGLLVDSLLVPAWVHAIVEAISRCSFAEVVLVVQNASVAGGNGSGLLRRAFAHRRHLLRRLYTGVDDLVFRSSPDPFERADLAPLLEGRPVLHVTPRQTRYSDYLDDADLAALRAYRLDVALRFGFRILRGGVLTVATHGVWSFHHGDNQLHRGGPAGFWEVMNGEHVTGSILQRLTPELDAGEVLYRSWASTYKLSVRKSKTNYYWKSSAFVMRKLRDLHEDGPAALRADAREREYRPYSERLHRAPENREMLGLLLRLGARVAVRARQRLLSVGQWFLAYKLDRGEGPASSLHDLRPLVPPRDRFWADPFPVETRAGYLIFLEELPYRTGKGHISVIEMDPSGAWKAPVKVLERDYHLSYPFVFAWNGSHYMIPETRARRSIELYRSTSFPFEWELEAVLLDDVRAVDTTLAEVDGTWWMFAGAGVEGASASDELFLFSAPSPLGPWRPHRRNPVKSDVRSARPAGRLFQRNGCLYRPAQDCSVEYGHAISINRIVRLTCDEFVEQEIAKILPRWSRHLERTHTLNSAGRLTVLDGFVRRSRLSRVGTAALHHAC